jgi:hypothetical protein
MRLGQRFESARRLSRFGVDKPNTRKEIVSRRTTAALLTPPRTRFTNEADARRSGSTALTTAIVPTCTRGMLFGMMRLMRVGYTRVSRRNRDWSRGATRCQPIGRRIAVLPGLLGERVAVQVGLAQPPLR